MEMKPITSSNLSTIGYDPDQQRLCVQFQTGKCYEYGGVEPETFIKLITAKSHGQAFNALIKNGAYPTKQIPLDEV